MPVMSAFFMRLVLKVECRVMQMRGREMFGFSMHLTKSAQIAESAGGYVDRHATLNTQLSASIAR